MVGSKVCFIDGVPFKDGYRRYKIKHEQGNNAIEIPQFDPLVAAKEKEIAQLRRSLGRVLELVPVKEKK